MDIKDIVSETRDVKTPSVDSSQRPFVPLWESMESGSISDITMTVTDQNNERYEVSFSNGEATVRHESSGKRLPENQANSLLEWARNQLIEVTSNA